MVSYEELIYHFTDIYLESAVQCSICKENYTMTDDINFLDEFMRFFVSLLNAVDDDKSLCVEDIKETLYEQKKTTLEKYRRFLTYKMMEVFISESQKSMTNHRSKTKQTPEMCVETIQGIMQSLQEHDSDSPSEFLHYLRQQEEELL